MIAYTGNGAYCFTNSLHMCLRAAGADDWITPGLIECLGGMAFGAMHMRFGGTPRFIPSNPNNDPDCALSRALALLGWTCDDTRGGDANAARERLRTTAFPALAGPCNYGALVYDSRYPHLVGADHFVTVLAVEDDIVHIHDPNCCPFVTLPVAEFMTAWRGDGVDYGPGKPPLQYVLRASFRRTQPVRRAEVVRRGVDAIRSLVTVPFEGPDIFGGPHAFRALMEDVRGNGAPALHALLADFSLMLGARRCVDAVSFLAEAGLEEAATIMERKARLYGQSLYNAVHQRWAAFAAQMEQLAEAEAAFVTALAA